MRCFAFSRRCLLCEKTSTVVDCELMAGGLNGFNPARLA
jgi:hypothetical protein